jgi:hypothetical protein
LDVGGQKVKSEKIILKIMFFEKSSRRGCEPTSNIQPPTLGCGWSLTYQRTLQTSKLKKLA